MSFGNGGFVADVIDAYWEICNKTLWQAYWERLDMQVNSIIFGVAC